MKKYDLYALGNALVDYEVEVNEEELVSFDAKKGLMTLVDQARQHSLIGHISNKNFKRSCGGSAGNTVITTAHLGGKTFCSFKVSDDEAGRFFIEDIKAKKVDCNFDHHQPSSGVTGKCIVMITPDAERTMETFLGISEGFSVDELHLPSLADSKYLYIEGYLLSSPTAKKAAIAARDFARKNNVKTAITFSDPGFISFFKAAFDEVLEGGFDLVFCNYKELLAYAGEENFEEALEVLKKIAKTFVVTIGPRGAYVYDGQKGYDVEGFAVKAVDTTGAGDVFAGAFLYCINHGFDFPKAARVANFAAAQVVSKFGARLNDAQIAEVKKNF